MTETRRILENKDVLLEMTQNLAQLRMQFGSFDASDKAAETTVNFIITKILKKSEHDR